MKRVSVRGLTKRYGPVTAVDGVSFDIPRGELVTLLGPSGCGKTTTLNMIAGFEEPDGGDITIGDRLISSCTNGRFIMPPHKRNLGMVFQSYALWPHMTVERNVAYGMKVRGLSREEQRRKAAEALRLVRLDKFADRYPGQLSGGQQQRVALARAIVYGPDVLLLDEPLSNLDATLREEMRVEIKDLQSKTGLTTVLVTHDQVEAMTMSDQIVVMNHGRVEQIGPPAQVYQQPASIFVAKFVGVANILEGRVAEVDSSGRRGTVTVGDRPVRCPLPGAKVGDRVTLSVRPENVAVSLASPHGEENNILVSSVEKILYLGGSQELWLRCGDHQLRTLGSQFPAVAPGQQLYLSIAPDAVRLLPN